MRDQTRAPARHEAPSRLSVILLLAILAAMLGCIPEGGSTPGGFSSVSGTVFDQPFTMYSGVAERAGNGYFVTLTDSSSFGCTSTPSGNYLRVVFEASAEGSSSALGNVTFSGVENNLDVNEGASSGTVTIDSIDEVSGSIIGSLSASGPTSDVSGSFDVSICP